jgi:hypothetical protein
MGNQNEGYGPNQHITTTPTNGLETTKTSPQDRSTPQNGSLEDGNLGNSALQSMNSSTEAVNPTTPLGIPPDGGWAAWMSGMHIFSTAEEPESDRKF